MTYPQSGSGYGQGDAGAQSAYGQQQYGQQQAGYGQQQYGQPQAAYGQQQYGQQQYGQQGYGYQAPKPAGQGLPANTTTILAGVIGGLGVIMLFLGFLAGAKAEGYRTTVTAKVFETNFVGPYVLLAVAGVLALVTFLLGREKWVAGGVFALTTVSALVTIFQFSTVEYDKGVGAILLLIFSILAFLASVVWLLIEGGQIKTAPAVAATPGAADASAQQYSYGQQAQQPAAYGQSDPAAQSPYGQPAQSGYGQPSSPSNPAPGASDSTTVFQQPDNGQQQ